MQNFLKEIGIHGHNHIVEPQNIDPIVVADKPHINHVRSETSLSEKYGKPQEVIGKGAFGIVRIAHKTEPKVPGIQETQ